VNGIGKSTEMIQVVLSHVMYLVGMLAAFAQTPVETKHVNLASITVIFVTIESVLSALTTRMVAA